MKFLDALGFGLKLVVGLFAVVIGGLVAMIVCIARSAWHY